MGFNSGFKGLNLTEVHVVGLHSNMGTLLVAQLVEALRYKRYKG